MFKTYFSLFLSLINNLYFSFLSLSEMKEKEKKQKKEKI